MIKVCVFSLAGPKWIVDDTFIFIRKFCHFLDGVAEVHVPLDDYIPSYVSSLSNLIIDRQGYAGNNLKWMLHLLREKSNISKKGVDIFMNAAGHSSLGALAAISALRTRKKSIVRVSGLDREIAKIKKHVAKFAAYNITEQVALKYATKILTNSNTLVPYLTKHGADIRKIHVISQGVDTALFQPVDVKEECPTVLFVANRLTPEKRPFDFIHVAAEVQKDFPEIRFRIISGEVGLEEARTLSQKLKADVEFLSHVPNEELPPYYSSAGVLLVTSSSEALPTAILEAMACGTPVIATDVGGVNELVEEGVTGKLVKVGDIASMKKSIIELCYNRKREEMGRNAREFIERHHSYDVVQREYVKLLQDTLNEG